MRYLLPRGLDLGWHVLRHPRLIMLGARRVHIPTYIQLDRGWVRDARFGTVIDVGANTGQFASAALALAPEATIYALEPLEVEFESLRRRFRAQPRVIPIRVAVGDQNKRVSFNADSYSKSSSLLPMAEMHASEFPWTGTVETVSVEMCTLDELLKDRELRQPVLLKIDVQGAESLVLRGATSLLGCVSYVLVEVSFELLYSGQASFDEVYRMLLDAGFHYRGSMDALAAPSDGRVLQEDALFERVID